jgi:excisionase family DNA binding protein
MLVLFLLLIAVGKLLTLRECAERTGNKVSTWRAWVLRRKVPYYKLSRSIRIAESDLERMIEQARVPPREVRDAR